MCIDICIGVISDMLTNTHIDMRIDMCMGMHMDMRADMHMGVDNC